jgi:UDPglucose 6-dehydrogenase
MNVGIVGLGKLGTPVALAMSLKGHSVVGYDINPAAMTKDSWQHREVGPDGESSIAELLKASDLQFGDIPAVVAHSEIIFVAVQTPHDPRYEGTTRLPDERADFNYSYLESAMSTLAGEIKAQGIATVVVIISTVLPGTIRSRILPLLNPLVKLCYNPYFIAMGTTIPDFLYPEFILFGVHDAYAADTAERFYRTITPAPFYKTSIENAELIKVAYNTFIGMKIVFTNTLMEICDSLPGCNVDQVTDALKLANKRLISPAYLSGGMGDGGGCHPRDNIAMSWLANKIGLSYNFFDSLMTARERQTEWIAKYAVDAAQHENLPIVVLGKAFKPETNLTVGSPAVLLANLIAEKYDAPIQYDPYVDSGEPPLDTRAIFVVATKHKAFAEYRFPAGSLVIDPWRFIPQQAESVLVWGLGE